MEFRTSPALTNESPPRPRRARLIAGASPRAADGAPSRPIFSSFSEVVSPLTPAIAAPRMSVVHASSTLQSGRMRSSPELRRMKFSVCARAYSRRSPSQSIMPPSHFMRMALSRVVHVRLDAGVDDDEVDGVRGGRDGGEKGRRDRARGDDAFGARTPAGIIAHRLCDRANGDRPRPDDATRARPGSRRERRETRGA